MIFGQQPNNPVLANICGEQWRRDWDAGNRDSLVVTAIDASGCLTYNWTKLDAQVAACAAKGTKLLHTFGSTPKFATMPGMAGAPLSIWGGTENMPWIPMLEDQFTTALVTRYKGKIAAYEDGNEVNYTGFDAATPAQQFDRLERRYLIVKSIDPAALVLMPSVTWSTATNNAVTALTAFFKAGFQAFADVVAFHGYIPTGQNDIRPTLAGIKAAMAAVNVTLPLWNTETIGSDGNKIAAASQRAWVIGHVGDNALAGVAAVFAYQVDNATHGGQFCTDGTTLNPIGEGWRDAFTLFGG